MHFCLFWFDADSTVAGQTAELNVIVFNDAAYIQKSTQYLCTEED